MKLNESEEFKLTKQRLSWKGQREKQNNIEAGASKCFKLTHQQLAAVKMAEVGLG